MNDFQWQAFYDRAEDNYLRPDEPKLLGTCHLCGWPVYSDSGHLCEDEATHYSCEEKENDL